jgi:hypothetical protein
LTPAGASGNVKGSSAWRSEDKEQGIMEYNGGHLGAMLAAAGIGVVVAILAVALAVSLLICWFLMRCFESVPAEHRKMEPGLVWLLLIPCFPLVWNFFVYPRLAESYKSYFDAHGRTDVGDCGRSLAMWYCILSVVNLALTPLSYVPHQALKAFAGGSSCMMSLAALALWIVFLVKANGYKNMIPEDSAPG